MLTDFDYSHSGSDSDVKWLNIKGHFLFYLLLLKLSFILSFENPLNKKKNTYTVMDDPCSAVL